MKLYKFMLTTYGETKITKQVLEAEEKPKTYSVFDGMWTSRVSKKDIGVVNGYFRDTVILLEDDMEMSLFLIGKKRLKKSKNSRKARNNYGKRSNRIQGRSSERCSCKL